MASAMMALQSTIGAATTSTMAVKQSAEDVAWFHRTMQTRVPPDVQSKLVFHRGFHDTKDMIHRPIENTLAAYEQAWAGGATYCECDIALTSDGHIVLCHDTTFKRLALFPDSSVAQKPPSQLTMAELMALPLRDGSRPPMLIDVLRSALMLGGGTGRTSSAKLVIEIKKGNPECCSALCQFFLEQPELIPLVAAVISFDYSIVHLFADEFAKARDSKLGGGGADGGAQAAEPSKKRRASIEEEEEACWQRPAVMFLTTAAPSKCSVQKNLSVMFGLEGGVASDEEGVFLAQVEAYLGGTEAAGAAEDEGGAATATANTNSPLFAEPRPDALDGIYMQYEDAMIVPGAARDRFAQLCAQHKVGVWMSVKKQDPDSLAVVQQLIEVGVTFVNTDMVRTFPEESWSAGPERPDVENLATLVA